VNFQEELGVADPILSDSIISRNPAIRGIKEFKYTINPQLPGSYTIPAIELAYYDVESKQYKVLKSQAIPITVTEGKNIVATNDALPGDINPIIQSGWEGSSQSGHLMSQAGYWGLYLLSGLICGLLLWVHKRAGRLAENQVLFKYKKANKIAWKRLASARKMLSQQQHRAFYEEVSKAIWLYLSDKLNLPLAELSKDNLVEALQVRSFSA